MPGYWLCLTSSSFSMPKVLESLNAALHRAFAADERVLLLGEDVLDPYGGAFKVTRGLSTAFPGRVLSTPISEAGIVGVAAGMALRGFRPVVEIMFGDFVTLIADQIINHAVKFRWMYNDQVRVPLILRTPMGGRRGYGPTHSQTLEKLFLGVPGLRVVSPTHLGDPGALLEQLILETQDPVLFVENKLLYLLPVGGGLDEFELQTTCGQAVNQNEPDQGPTACPLYRLTIKGAPAPTLSLAAYGYMAELARQAMLKLAFEDEIFAELLVPTDLKDFNLDISTHRLLSIEEGTRALGWGAGIISRAAEVRGEKLEFARQIAARDLPVPASGPLEALVLPGVEDIMQAAHTAVK
jgi:pyruvate/2-oxoglutarate/acetoin dehydrogenase E1 component